ncbi:SusD/RagB family nutrient-binding outer membrane lipoprotein [Niabella sp.]|uniref:SusD/RagB family nutrient-binding outer membrane lipoprotein n=1 Tax=Niabella sp. TaxID=1962976 RepID=UPI00262235F9|nr:SusD/RagB family nutrient-binding outer membrane lipoprotein [Niabella sp.]
MKNKRIVTYFLSGLLVAAALTSCKKFVDVNANPNSPEDVPPKVLLPTTSVGISFTNVNQLGLATGLMMQHNAAVAQWTAFDVYNLADQTGVTNAWSYEIYSGTVNNLRILIAKTQETSPVYSGIAKIELAYIMGLTTDLWGDIPYSEAGLGLANTSPRYDKQEDIYKGNASAGIQSLFDLVKEGMADLDKPSALKPTTDDPFYGGDISKWRRAGNSLLLKFAIQLSNVDPTTAANVIKDVVAGDKFINDNSLNFSLNFGTSAGNQNPVYVRDIIGSFKNNEMLSSRFLALMRAQNDTVRLAKYYTKPNSVFTSYENGSTAAAVPAANRSQYNAYVVGASGEGPARLLTYHQVQFILAEAAVRYGISGDANTYYQNGIKASMKLAGMTDAEINTYFTTNTSIVTLSGSNDDKIKQIITQKYISLVGNGYEAYNDYRRTGYPVLSLALNASGDDPTTIPKRFPYLASESNNPNQPNPRPKTNVKVWWGL